MALNIRENRSKILRYSFVFLNILFIFLTLLYHFLNWNKISTFIISFITLSLLSATLGKLTEIIEEEIGGTYISVYANLATNIPEIIIGIVSMKNGHIEIAKLSLVGSVLSNLSFVYGFTILISGLKFKQQHFNAKNAELTTIPVLFAALSFVLLILFNLEHYNTIIEGEKILFLSRFDLFTFITPSLGVTFTGFILVPCIGNLTEHAIAVVFGIKDKMDIVIDNTGGSAIQIIYFVLPIIVISGWIMNLSVSIYFSPFISFSIVLCSFIFKLFIIDGESNLIEGMISILLYDSLQNIFFYEIYDDETIINTVMSYIESKPKNYDSNSILIYNELKYQFEIDVEDETLRRMNWKNSDIKNTYDFRLIHDEVKKINLNYSSIIAKFDTNDKIKDYEESKEFKYIVNRESLRQYRLLY
ncbi:8714_t:CDS:2 [Scutellospora calospora]|uniref:8714_t:CDS:1 n=1 Tax=Scutellospora calospora TaxID=85575 RepID=A0ACA9LQ67_9GLOM|nr:8714_t:CDS:2 [Scutellospora calospora]